MTSASATDDGPALALAAMHGDHAALRALWERHRSWVAAALMAHKPASADLDDLLQEVALTVIAKVSTLEDPANFPGWLKIVAVNAARLAGRKQQSGPRFVRSDDPGDGSGGTSADSHARPSNTSVVDGLAHDAEARRVMALAMDLPDEYREPLLLKAVKGLSYREIGTILGLPETTIETRIARGRRMLRERAQPAQARCDAGAANGSTNKNGAIDGRVVVGQGPVASPSKGAF